MNYIFIFRNYITPSNDEISSGTGSEFVGASNGFHVRKATTTMHYSKMCTVRCSGRLPGGGVVCPGGVSPVGGDRQPDTCENITFPQLLLRTINIHFRQIHASAISTALLQRVGSWTHFLRQ